MAKIVIDTDPGTDDALALIMALCSPELDIQGLTTVGGNARLADTTRNTLDRAPDQAGLDHWASALDAGVGRAEVVLAFSESAEHVVLTAATKARGP